MERRLDAGDCKLPYLLLLAPPSTTSTRAHSSPANGICAPRPLITGSSPSPCTHTLPPPPPPAAPTPSRCIAFLLLLVVCGVVAIIVVKIINPNRKKVLQGAQAALNDTLNAINNTDIGGTIIGGAKNITDTATGAVREGVTGSNGRRMLLHQLLQHALELNARLEAGMH